MRHKQYGPLHSFTHQVTAFNVYTPAFEYSPFDTLLMPREARRAPFLLAATIRTTGD